MGDLHHKQDFQSGESFPVADNVAVISNLGHTSENDSVLVRGARLGTVAIVENLFQCEVDLDDSTLWKSRSRDSDLQEENRRKIFQIADYIIPGHRKMFKVPTQE
jgi:hypothetical protein